MSLPERRSDATTAMAPSDWSIERASAVLQRGGWGAGFFSVNEKGHVVVHPMGQPGPVIDLMDVVEDIRERKIGFPCVVRFQDVLRARVKQINEAFGKAIAEMGYGGALLRRLPDQGEPDARGGRGDPRRRRARTTTGSRRGRRASSSSSSG